MTRSAYLSLTAALIFLVNDLAAKEIYAAPSIIPASMKVCDGLLKLKKLKGKTYATMSQEVAASGKRVWITSCAYR